MKSIKKTDQIQEKRFCN